MPSASVCHSSTLSIVASLMLLGCAGCVGHARRAQSRIGLGTISPFPLHDFFIVEYPSGEMVLSCEPHLNRLYLQDDHWIATTAVPPIGKRVFVCFSDTHGKKHQLLVPVNLPEVFVGDLYFLVVPAGGGYQVKVCSGEAGTLSGSASATFQLKRRNQDEKTQGDYSMAVLTDFNSRLHDFHCIFHISSNQKETMEWPIQQRDSSSPPKWRMHEQDAPLPCGADFYFRDALNRPRRLRAALIRGNATLPSGNIDLLPADFKGELVWLIHEQGDHYHLRLFIGRPGQFSSVPTRKALLEQLAQRYRSCAKKIDIRPVPCLPLGIAQDGTVCEAIPCE